MVILGVTGSIMEFEAELDRSLHPGLSYITPGRQAPSLSEIGDAVSRRFGGEPVVAYAPSLSPNLSSQVPLPSGIVPLALLAATGTVLGFEDQLAPVIYRLGIPEGGKCFMKRTIALLLVLGTERDGRGLDRQMVGCI